MSDRLATEQIRRRYDEMAGNWRLLGIVDALTGINRLRKRQFADARGDVLDVACGTGENFDYLTRAESLTALDLSSKMVEEARRRQRQLGRDIRLLVADAQEMPFSDGSFDTVVSALSTCTFPDYIAAFGEMIRVTRQGGRVLLVEHGRASVGWIAGMQDRNIERVHQRSGCRNNRDVGAEVADAGLHPASHLISHLGMLHRIAIQVGDPAQAGNRRR